jgi:methyl-accepting chemotaxis protein
MTKFNGGFTRKVNWQNNVTLPHLRRWGILRRSLNLITICILIFLFATVILVTAKFSISQETQSEEAKNTVALVDQAVALLQSKGTDAFAEFRTKDSQWLKGDTYIFAFDTNGIEVFHPVQPDLEGKSIIDMKDANGKAFIQERIEIANTKGSGWVEYMWPKPGESEPSKKMVYMKKVKTGEDTIIVASGYYTD